MELFTREAGSIIRDNRFGKAKLGESCTMVALAVEDFMIYTSNHLSGRL